MTEEVTPIVKGLEAMADIEMTPEDWVLVANHHAQEWLETTKVLTLYGAPENGDNGLAMPMADRVRWLAKKYSIEVSEVLDE